MVFSAAAEQVLRDYLSDRDGLLLGYDRSPGPPAVLHEPREHHGYIQLKFASVLLAYVEAHDLGKVFVEVQFYTDLEFKSSRQPDASFVVKSRVPVPLPDRGLSGLVPDLVIEVISPSDRMTNMLAKVQEYLQAGVRLVWLLHPLKCMGAVYRPDKPPQFLSAENFFDGEDVVPGFRCVVGSVVPRVADTIHPEASQ